MIGAEGFRIVKKQNVLFHGIVDHEKAQRQHAEVVKAIGAIQIPSSGLPDEVFVANTALPLPMLPPTFIMAKFKYAQRKEETDKLAPYLRKIGKVIQWPYASVLEGQGETKMFYGGKIIVVGYGFRSSKQSVSDLEEMLHKIYKSHGLTPPVVLGVKLLDPRYYHMDIAAHAISSNECLLHKGAISDQDIQKMEDHGIRCIVRSFGDPFALNCVMIKGKHYTHVLTTKARAVMKRLGLNVVELDVSEFEKSGGALRCMVLSFLI